MLKPSSFRTKCVLIISDTGTRTRAVDDARKVVRILVFLVIPLSIGNFIPALWGGISDLSAGIRPDTLGIEPQQVATVSLWVMVLGLSLAPRRMTKSFPTTGLQWATLMLICVVISPLWGVGGRSGLLKALAFLVCSLGVWRAAFFITLAEFFRICKHSLFFLTVMSLAAVLVMPQISIAHGWQQEGLWQGSFVQKQQLGICAAYLLFFSPLGFLRRPGWFDVCSFGIGLISLIGSGSRSGAVMAGISAFSAIALRWPRCSAPLISLIGLNLLIGTGILVYFFISDADYIPLFGYSLDFDGRTRLWSYAIQLWTNGHFLLGYGLNGFWTQPDVYYNFLGSHRWVLTNYHNGYIAVAVETGLVGFAIFAVLVGRISSRLRLLLRYDTDNPALEMAVGFLVMTFTLNLTEAVLIRSTSFGQVALSFVIAKLLETPRIAKLRSYDGSQNLTAAATMTDRCGV